VGGQILVFDTEIEKELDREVRWECITLCGVRRITDYLDDSGQENQAGRPGKHEQLERTLKNLHRVIAQLGRGTGAGGPSEKELRTHALTDRSSC
jgi:hypothetical protein